MYGDDGSLPSRLTRRAHRDEDMSEDGSDRDSEHSGAEGEGDDEER